MCRWKPFYSYTEVIMGADVNSSTLRGALIAGIFSVVVAVGGAMTGGAVKGYYDIQLARQKQYADLVLLALRSDSVEIRKQSLKFMLDARLITDPDVRSGLDAILTESRKDSSAVPQFKEVSASLAPPIIANSRVFLLAGTEQRARTFQSLEADLAKAGFNVIGKRVLASDPGRPDVPEVRYFHATDSTQAAAIAAALSQRSEYRNIGAKAYFDSRARPGYIEIWFGR